jgi:hypothetical protein
LFQGGGSTLDHSMAIDEHYFCLGGVDGQVIFEAEKVEAR